MSTKMSLSTRDAKEADSWGWDLESIVKEAFSLKSLEGLCCRPQPGSLASVCLMVPKGSEPQTSLEKPSSSGVREWS